MGGVIGYLRVSTEKQDLEKQRHLILEYAHKEKLHITEFIEVEASSRKSSKERRIDYLRSKLKPDSVLIVAELSRLERSMIDCINLVMSITELGVEIKFIRQPELNLKGLHGKLILAIFGYFAEAEREYIRLRTKQGLEAARASGKVYR
jgi:DNA invertase Pin-like site-specific DNA recombinase